MKKVKTIADLLPEGLEESTVTEIAKVVDSIIEEEVSERMSLLEGKVHAYFRTHIDDLKDHALRELEEENDTFRNARLFEELRSFMSLELSQGDEDNAVASMSKDINEAKEELSVMGEELNKSLVENEKLENTLKILSAKKELLDESMKNLENEKMSLEESLEEAKEVPFKSSEKAVIIAENIAHQRTPISDDNEFLTKDMMKFMPFTD
tara:strand:+ start:271 stop:897 length:627 start_codon:yes stop_codon:yes gene_type:complete